MKKNIAILSLLVLGILVAGLVAVILLVQRPQEIQKEVVVVGGAAEVILSPQNATLDPGEVLPVEIQFNTGGFPISSLSMRISYSFTESVPEIDVIDEAGNPASRVVPNSSLLSSGDWSFPVNSVTRSGGTVTIDLAAINTNIAGFSSSQPTNLATLYLKANQVTSDAFRVSFDPSLSKIMTKADPPSDILKTPVVSSFTVVSPTPTPTPTPLPVSLKFKIRFQGVTDSVSNMLVDISFEQGESLKYLFEDYSTAYQSGYYGGVLPTGSSVSIIPSTYDVYIKSPTFLRRKFENTSLVAGENVYDWTQVQFIVGDFDGDNDLDILDIRQLLKEYVALSTVVTSSNAIYDVDTSGTINISDIAIVLSNYTHLRVLGD